MAHFRDSFWLISASIFVAGLVGSPHCLSMCGPIIFNFGQGRSRLLAYQLGRMASYTLAGGLFGGFAGALTGPAQPLWLIGLILTLIGSLMLLNGYRAIKGKTFHFPMPKFIHKKISQIFSFLRLSSLPPVLSSVLVGFFTVLLPCGHLYGFLLGSAATGTAFHGALFMLAFCVGSMPLPSLAAGVGGGWLVGILQKKGINHQRWTGGVMIIAGFLSLFSFASRADNFIHHQQISNSSTSEKAQPMKRCH